MLLTRHQSSNGPQWALDGRYLPEGFSLGKLLSMPRYQMDGYIRSLSAGEPAGGPLLAPIEPLQDVWAGGAIYLRSREARETESAAADVYMEVYHAERPELFYKSTGWRVVAHQQPIRIRWDSLWSLPEPELTLVINAGMEIIGYCAGNDVSSRDIEGKNPLYLPQAKIYNRSCALGPGIELLSEHALDEIPIEIKILRAGKLIFESATSTAKMKRKMGELVAFLGTELEFPLGAFLMTGTGIVPPDDFTLHVDDRVSVIVGGLTLTNPVAS